MDKKPVNESAVFRRLKDELLLEGKGLRACAPNSMAAAELGRYYTVDERNEFIDAKHVDIEKLARERKLLTADEHVVWGA